ncbi:Flp pilus assembly protein CpaB, partial [Vibrio fluvialis]
QNPDIAIGRRLKEEVAPGTYLTTKLLAPNRPVIDDLPEDYRAIAIKAGEVLTVGGYLQPGDFVDVMLLLKPNKESGAMTSARTIASNLMVLAIGENQTSKDNFQREDHAKSVVLAVHESIAPILLLADASGEIRLAAVGSKEVAQSNRPDSSFA